MTVGLRDFNPKNKRITSTQYDLLGRATAVQSPLGFITRTKYDDAGRVLSVVSPRALPLNKWAVVDLKTTPEGSYAASDKTFWRLDWNHKDDIDTRVADGANAFRTTFTYDDRGRLESKTLSDPDNTGEDLGTRFQYTYYDNGMTKNETQIVRTTSRSKSILLHQYTYDLINHSSTRKQLNENVQKTVSDKSGATTSITNERLKETTFGYDAIGRQIRQTLPKLSEQTDGPTTLSQYDQAGNLRAQIAPDSAASVMTYDEFGRPTSTQAIEFMGAKEELESSELVISGADEFEIILTPDDGTWTDVDYVRIIGSDGISFDLYPVESSTTDTVTIHIDPNESDDSVTFANLALLLDDPDVRVQKAQLLTGSSTAYSFDQTSGDQITVITDGRGFKTKTVSDKAGRVTDVFASRNSEGQPVYDKISHSNYDSLGQIKNDIVYSQKDGGGGRTTSFTYDALGRLVGQEDPPTGQSAPARVTTFGYDNESNLIWQTDARGNQRISSAGSDDKITIAAAVSYNLNTTTYAYDPWNRMTRHTLPDTDGTHEFNEKAPSTTVSYSDFGNTVTQTDPNSNVTRYSYDRLNRLINEQTKAYRSDTQPNVTVFRNYKYDQTDNLVLIQDRNSRLIFYKYDAVNRLTDEKWYPEGTDYADFNTTSPQFEAEQSLHFTYDTAGRLTSGDSDYTGGGDTAADYVYTYDPLGQVETYTDTYTVEQQSPPHVTFTNQYDKNGNRTQVDAAVGSSPDFQNLYRYNQLNLLDRVYQHASEGASTSAVLDKMKEFQLNLVGQYETGHGFKNVTNWDSPTFSGTAVENSDMFMQYDAAGRLDYMTLADDRQFDYALDINDRVTQLTVPDAGTRNFEYDDKHELKGWTYDDGKQNTELEAGPDLLYDKNFNRMLPGGTRGIQLAAADNRITHDENWDYQYDGEGNLIKKVRKPDKWYWTFAYDHRNRLLESVFYDNNGTPTVPGDDSPVSTTKNTYDAADRRIRKEVDSSIGPDSDERYVYDASSSQGPGGANVALVLSGASSTILSRYLWGDGSDEIIAEDVHSTGNNTWSTHWFGADHQGSVRRVIDGNGNVIQSIDYDAFGGVRAHQDTPVESLDFNVSSAAQHFYEVAYSEDLELNVGKSSNSSSAILLDGWYNDDLAMLIGAAESVGADGDVDTIDWSIALPADAIIFRNTADGPHFRVEGDETVTFTDGPHEWMLDDENSEDNQTGDLDEGGFETRYYMQGVTAAELRRRGWVDEDGIAHVKWAVVGDYTARLKVDMYLAQESLPRFLYTGQQYDSESEMYAMGSGVRFMDPGSGRFNQQDPAREGTNWQAYVGNNPINLVDPTGLAAAFTGTPGLAGAVASSLVSGPLSNYSVQDLLLNSSSSAVASSWTAGPILDVGVHPVAVSPVATASVGGYRDPLGMTSLVDLDEGSTAAYHAVKGIVKANIGGPDIRGMFNLAGQLLNNSGAMAASSSAALSPQRIEQARATTQFVSHALDSVHTGHTYLTVRDFWTGKLSQEQAAEQLGAGWFELYMGGRTTAMGQPNLSAVQSDLAELQLWTRQRLGELSRLEVTVDPATVGTLGGNVRIRIAPSRTGTGMAVNEAGFPSPMVEVVRTTPSELIADARAQYKLVTGRKMFLNQFASTPEAQVYFAVEELALMRKNQLPKGWMVHHKQPLFRGGDNSYENLILVRKQWHAENFFDLHFYPEGKNPFGRN